MSGAPLILFGAFDRHNFGDLLLGEIAAAHRPDRSVVFAGLAERDLSACGGRRVVSAASLAEKWGDEPADVLQTGGEVLACSAYEAAVMLLDPEAARQAIARYDRDPAARRQWAQSMLDTRREVPYLLPRSLFRRPGAFRYAGIGGVELGALPASMRQEAFAALGAADFVWVRDAVTREYLRQAGVETVLAPDPAAATAALCGSRIEPHRVSGEPARAASLFPQGYLAVQFAAEWGDDATLRTIARQLALIQARTGLGIVLFRAGAAPWHDDLDVYHRLIGLMPGLEVEIFRSLHLWDICALLANAAAYCGTSLHGRIVAEAYGRPAVNLVRDHKRQTKHVAYDATWGTSVAATIAEPDGLSAAVRGALLAGGAAFHSHGRRLERLALEAMGRG